MRNSRDDVKRQFELLYQRISQLKEEFECCPSYDSSGNSTESEYDMNELIGNDILEKGLAAEVQNQGDAANNTLSDDKREKLIISDGMASERDSNVSTVTHDSTNDADHENKTDDNKNLKVHKKDCNESERSDLRDDITISKTELTSEKQKVNGHTINCAEQNEITNGCTANSSIESIERQTGSTNKIPLCSTLFKFNIKPRRPLHENSSKGQDMDETYSVSKHIEEARGEPVFKEDSDNSFESLDASTNFFSIEDYSQTDMLEETGEEMKFIRLEDGYISFTVASEDYVTSRSDYSDDNSDSDSGSEVQFLHFEDGFVRFDVKFASNGINNLKVNYFENTSGDDIFLEDETVGIAALFNSELTDSNSESNTLYDYSENTGAEYLDGLLQLFQENAEFDTDIKTSEETDNENETKSVEDDDASSSSVGTECTSLSDMPDALVDQHHHMEPSIRRIEYSFAGVVLLNTLPRLLTSSLVSSLFSSPSFSFAFYKPMNQRSACCLSSSDLAKLTFSSQDLPFKKICEMNFPERESHFETLSTKSTSSKGSSLESVCES